MQLFYLLPFVGVVSHAAALPQPAELSETYSNGVDITLASLFETRSYQPVLNTREDPVALMSLERRANSGGNSGGSAHHLHPNLPLAKLKTQSALSLAKMILTVENYLYNNRQSRKWYC
ncbi:hypothetical protein BASA81_018608 [Batrachochytrium salamandrivorans]|nr:hypothetical protein BASA81_018608 [Batrachochytrium salamandrivorans]